MDELVAHTRNHSPRHGWVARPKSFRQALDRFSEDEQLVQNSRLRLEITEESGFIEVFCKRNG